MSDTKKSGDSIPTPPPEPLRENVEFVEVVPCRGVYDSVVTNTLPPPPNPNQGGGQKEEK